MDWTCVRHVILTVGRERNAAWYYEVIRFLKEIPRTVAVISPHARRWLWVLEFHTGGWPHWHLMIEHGRRMIGHENIRRRWRWGHVWEARIRDRSHWQRILGYHQQKGYLAGEAKGHQLSLPDYLCSRNRVRKFGRKADPDPTVRDVPRETSSINPPRAAASPYRERFRRCGDGSRVCIDGHWAYEATDAAIIEGLAHHYNGDPVNGEYDCDADVAAYILSQARKAQEQLD
jgi:hypothetical protein